jgi:urease subunit beta
MKPGEYFLQTKLIVANLQRPTARVLVKNRGDRPIQVGSHYHFFEANRALEFDREAAYGMRLNIAAGTAVRFEPGEEKPVELTPFGGARIVHGFSGLVAGALDAPGVRERALGRLREAGFHDAGGNQEKTR